MIYLLTTIGLTPGGSSTVHIYTQTIHRTTQTTTNLKECGSCPVFASFTLAFALQLRKKHGKTSVSVRKTSVRIRKTSDRVRKTSVRVRKTSVRIRKTSDRVRKTSVRVRKTSVRVRKPSVRVRKTSIRVEGQNAASPNWCGYAIRLTGCNEAQLDGKRRTGDYL